jgi:hypothetical protein
MMEDRAPIAFFAYNRPEHTSQALESLSRCDGARESELFIYCDGPKGSKDEKAVSQVREIVKSHNWCGTVQVIEKEVNLGLAHSIIHGVTEIVNRYGRIIVLEDDLVLSPQFLNFMNDALDKYEDIQKVMHVSGYMFPVRGKLPETFFYRATSCWGWATWKRAWDKFEPDAKKLLDKFEDEKQRWEFDIKGTKPYYKMLHEQTKKNTTAWAARWYASVFFSNGICLHPGISLVNNIGHDGTGIHCCSTGVFDVDLSRERVSHFTQDIKESEQVVLLMADFYITYEKPFYIRGLYKLRNIINRILRTEKTNKLHLIE